MSDAFQLVDHRRSRPPRWTRLRALAELLRLANLPTAVADVWMGYVLAVGSLQPALLVLGFTLCGGLLYTAGMVLNDCFDAWVDAVERPERPIPSGRIALGWAHVIGWNLLVGGVLVSLVLSVLCQSKAPGLIAWMLSVTIVAYNSWLKHTRLGPLALGLCRAGNVLLGISPAIIQLGPKKFLVLDTPLAPCLGMGCYVAGVAWFAREEQTTSRRGVLLWGMLLVLAGLVISATAPWWEFAAGRLLWSGWSWLAVWLGLGFAVLPKFFHAWQNPTAQRVQRAVGWALLLIIPIDAVWCWGYVGVGWALPVLALWVPARLLSRRLPLT